MTKRYDYIAIGGGGGGITSINRAAVYDQKYAPIEAKELGGACVSVGCIPKKVMWHTAQVRETIRVYGPDYGSDTIISKLDWDKLIATRTAYIDRIHISYDNMLSKNNVGVIKGFVRFVDAKTVEANGEITTADHTLIATGGHPSCLAVPGAEYSTDSNGFSELPTLPEHMAVVGVGYTVTGLAGVINGPDTQTRPFVRERAPLRSSNPMIVDTLVEMMNAESPTLHIHAIPKAAIKNVGGSLILQLEDGRSETVDCSTQVIGRESETSNFNLVVTGMKTNEKGYIVVDKFRNISVSSTYTADDNTGAVELMPVVITADRHLSECLSNSKPDEHPNYNNVLTVVPGHLSIGTVDLIKQRTREQHGDDRVKTYKSSFTTIYTAVTSYRQSCHIKLVYVGSEGKIVDTHGIGFDMDGILQSFAMALRMGATKRDFDNTVAAYPTVAEEFVTMR